MNAAQLVALEAARDMRVNIESDAIKDAAIDLRLDPKAAVVEARKLMGNLYRTAGVRACAMCGCTDEEGCVEGCSWVETEDGSDLCSSCEQPWPRRRRRA